MVTNENKLQRLQQSSGGCRSELTVGVDKIRNQTMLGRGCGWSWWRWGSRVKLFQVRGQEAAS